MRVTSIIKAVNKDVRKTKRLNQIALNSPLRVQLQLEKFKSQA